MIYVRECALPMFFSKSFIVSGLMFKSLIHFEFVFVYGVRKFSNFILLHIIDNQTLQSNRHQVQKEVMKILKELRMAMDRNAHYCKKE